MSGPISGISLEGKVALVTGASRGIGAVVACRLAQAGAKVGVNYYASPDAAKQVVDSITTAGGEALLVGGDVSQEEAAEGVIKQTVEHWGSIDILVNNAGINRDRLLIRMKPEDFDSVISVNLRGAFLCTRYVMTHLIRQRSGRVINMSAVVGLSGREDRPSYSVAKYLASQGYRIIPVNPQLTGPVLGEQPYPDLGSVPTRRNLLQLSHVSSSSMTSSMSSSSSGKKSMPAICSTTSIDVRKSSISPCDER